jgi:hypothetical protein
MTSVGMHKVDEWAKSEDAKLLATDKRLSRSILVIHEEGSVFCIQRAYLVKVRSDGQDWLVCFSEHQGTHVWSSGELAWYGEFKGRNHNIEQVRLDPSKPKTVRKRVDTKKK